MSIERHIFKYPYYTNTFVVRSWRVKLEIMKREKVFLVGVHRYCFRAGEKCEIVGVEYVQPSEDAEYRLAYKVKYEDGIFDWVAFTDVETGNWEYVSELEAGFGMLPGVSR